jgi:hypothetical protein
MMTTKAELEARASKWADYWKELERTPEFPGVDLDSRTDVLPRPAMISIYRRGLIELINAAYHLGWTHIDIDIKAAWPETHGLLSVYDAEDEAKREEEWQKTFDFGFRTARAHPNWPDPHGPSDEQRAMADAAKIAAPFVAKTKKK